MLLRDEHEDYLCSFIHYSLKNVIFNNQSGPVYTENKYSRVNAGDYPEDKEKGKVSAPTLRDSFSLFSGGGRTSEDGCSSFFFKHKAFEASF